MADFFFNRIRVPRVQHYWTGACRVVDSRKSFRKLNFGLSLCERGAVRAHYERSLLREQRTFGEGFKEGRARAGGRDQLISPETLPASYKLTPMMDHFLFSTGGCYADLTTTLSSSAHTTGTDHGDSAKIGVELKYSTSGGCSSSRDLDHSFPLTAVRTVHHLRLCRRVDERPAQHRDPVLVVRRWQLNCCTSCTFQQTRHYVEN